MVRYTGIIKKSRTLDLAAVTGAIGAAITALPQMQSFLTAQDYGIIFMILSVAQGYLRAKTFGPIGQKGGNDD